MVQGVKRSRADDTGENQDTKKSRLSGNKYEKPAFENYLKGKGMFMHNPTTKPCAASQRFCRMAFSKQFEVPQGTYFNEDIFEDARIIFAEKNEATFVKDMTPLLIPSPVLLGLLDADLSYLQYTTETANELWSRCIRISNTCPKPDFSAGFNPSAFNKTQLDKLSALIENPNGSLVQATPSMYFPFFVCEVKSCNIPLIIADRQNAHSMFIAARAVVQLFKAAGCESEVNRKILSFSISHNNENVKIFSSFPVTRKRGSTTYYRHMIKSFQLSSDLRWTTRHFVMYVYQFWLPLHLDRIHKALDKVDPTNNIFKHLETDETVSDSSSDRGLRVKDVFAKAVTRAVEQEQAVEREDGTEFVTEVAKNLDNIENQDIDGYQVGEQAASGDDFSDSESSIGM
jgi:hypothetical protein